MPDHCRFFGRDKSRIDFRFHCSLELADGFDSSEEALQYWYAPEMTDEYGLDTVPVAKGGYYFYDIIWIKPDGSLVAVLPDGVRVNCFKDLLDYLCSEFVFAGMPDFVECDYEAKEG